MKYSVNIFAFDIGLIAGSNSELEDLTTNIFEKKRNISQLWEIQSNVNNANSEICVNITMAGNSLEEVSSYK